MLYRYLCPNCHKSKGVEVPLGNDLPKDVTCPQCGNTMKHDFCGQVRSQATILPLGFQAVNRLGIQDTSKLYRKDASIEDAPI